MRGRKPASSLKYMAADASRIKKESPNEGTETLIKRFLSFSSALIKKESPNEGTETLPFFKMVTSYRSPNKKRIPE